MKIQFSVKSAEVKVGEQVAIQATGVSTVYGIKDGIVSAKNKAASVVINSAGEGMDTAVKYEGAAFDAEVSFGEVKELAGKARDFFAGFAVHANKAKSASESEDCVSDFEEEMYDRVPSWAVARIFMDEDNDYAFEFYEEATGERTGISENLTASCYYRKEILIGNIKEEDFATFVNTFDSGVDGYLSVLDVDTLALYLEDLQEENEKNIIF